MTNEEVSELVPGPPSSIQVEDRIVFLGAAGLDQASLDRGIRGTCTILCTHAEDKVQIDLDRLDVPTGPVPLFRSCSKLRTIEFATRVSRGRRRGKLWLKLPGLGNHHPDFIDAKARLYVYIDLGKASLFLAGVWNSGMVGHAKPGPSPFTI